MRNTVQRTKQNLTAETIVMTKWIGLKGSALIARKREKDLLTYFSPCFVDRVKEFDRLTAPGPEEEIFREMGIDCFRETGDGGVFDVQGAGLDGTGIDRVVAVVDVQALAVRDSRLDVV